jgi:hypothetical protein
MQRTLPCISKHLLGANAAIKVDSDLLCLSSSRVILTQKVRASRVICSPFAAFAHASTNQHTSHTRNPSKSNHFPVPFTLLRYAQNHGMHVAKVLQG